MNLEALRHGLCVSAGKDRHDENHLMIWGVIPLTVKVSAKDTGGNLCLFEHKDMGKGGPPRHVHYEQDEWFYAIKGEFLFEVDGERFVVKPGDSIFGPRKVPHAFAVVSDEPATLLVAVTPAGSFEDFLHAEASRRVLPGPDEMAKAFEAHSMAVVGPPLLAG